MDDDGQGDLFGGGGRGERGKRDDAIRRVIDNEREIWRNNYQRHFDLFVGQLMINQTFIGEDVRMFCRGRGMGEPHHHNVWGAMFRGSITRLLKDKCVISDGVQHMKSVGSHARLSPRYRKLNY